MGTPFKQLKGILSPKVLAHLSPTTHSIFDFSLKPLAPQSNHSSLKNVNSNVTPNALRLHIPKTKIGELNQSPVNNINFTSPLIKFDLINGEEGSSKEENKFIDILKVNTPVKLQILAEGLETRKNLNVLGRGRFGVVVKGSYYGRTVAVKVLKLQPSLEYSINESNVLNLRNEYIVNTIDVILNKSLNYAIVLMEYVENCKSLQKHLDEQSINVATYITFSIHICKGLSYCHKNRVYHLDIKPTNILISSEGVCKLCDFGNSYRAEKSANYIHQGTVAYTAPEILMGERPSAKCDIYSLGILMWQMKSGQCPYSNIKDKDVLIYKVVKFGLRPENEFLSSNAFSKIYRKCWSRDPENRPNTLDTLYSLYQITS